MLGNYIKKNNRSKILKNIICKIITMLRHYAYIFAYVSAIIVYSVNFCFPLFILKKIKLFNNICTKILGYMLMKFQSIVKLSMLIGGIELYAYKEKNMDLLFKNNAVIISNHLSELDSMYIGSLYSDILPQYYKIISFAKNTIRFYPFVGWITLVYDTIFVQNKNSYPNKRQHGYIEKKLKQENDNNIKKNIIIFIEGTTFDRKIKENREFFSDSISYNNLLIPKTNGLYMIHKNVDIDEEIYLTLKFEGNYKIEEYTIMGLLTGKKPKSVHMFVDTIPYNKDIKLLENRDKYNKIVYQNFKSIDKRLDDDINVWEYKYDKTKLSVNLIDIVYFLIFLISSGYTINGLLYSGNYQLYFFVVSIIYVFFGYKEI